MNGFEYLILIWYAIGLLQVEFLLLALRPMSGFAQNWLAHEPSYGCGSKSL